MAKYRNKSFAPDLNLKRQNSVRTSSALKQQRQNQLKNKRMRKSSGSAAVKGAQKSLKRFRQSTILAVAITSFIFLIVLGASPEIAAQIEQDEPTQRENVNTNVRQNVDVAAEEALTSVQEIWYSFLDQIPKILIAIAVIIISWLLIKLIAFLVGKTVSNWRSGEGIVAITKIILWLVAIGIVVTVVAGDIRAMLGSVGLIGLALSWALQSPIESFTGWLMNSFKHYYKVGDRIAVGEVFGDVYKIDFLNTTVWEIGGPNRSGFVQAEQPTGRLVTFPNNEVLNGTVVNLTRDFPFVWDELSVMVANESQFDYTIKVLETVAQDVIGKYMQEPARQYENFLKRAGLESSVPDRPQIFLSSEESGTNFIIRYLVGARERRRWKSELIRAISAELSKKDHSGKILTAYPRQQVQFIRANGKGTDATFYQSDLP